MSPLQFTSGRENPYPQLGDDADGPLAFEALATALDDAPRITQGTAASKSAPSSGKAWHYATDEDAFYYWNGTTWKGPWYVSKTRTIGRSFTTPDDTPPPTSGLPAKFGVFWVPVPTGVTTKLVSAYSRISSGTSVSWKLQRATGGGSFTDITGWGTTGTPLVTTSTAAQGTLSDPADVTLADGDALAVVIVASAGTPAGFSVQVNLSETG